MTAQVDGPSHTSKRALLVPILVWLVLALGLHWAAPMLNAVNVFGFPLAFYLAAQGALIAFAMLGFWAAAARREPEGSGNALAGLSTAGIWMSGALPVALAGALYAYGYDGLSFILGLSGGLLLVACNVAPAFSKSGTATLTQLLAVRTGGRLAVWAAAAMATVSLILIVSAEFEFVRRIAAPLFVGVDSSGTGVAAVAAVSLAAIAVAHIRDITAVWLQAAVYVLILVAVIAAAVVMSMIAFDGAIPHLTYGLGLRNLANLERSLVLEGLSDPSLVRPFVKPNTSFSLENFLAISLSMMLGAAAMSIVLDRWMPAATGPASQRQASAWALFFAALLLMTLPAVAVFAKLDVYTAVASGITADTAPTWLKQQASSATAPLCPQGCADPGRLHVGDIAIEPEAILPSAPSIARLPGYAAWSFVALLAFAAILSAGSITASLTRMLADAPPDNSASGGPSTRPLGRAASFAIAAALTAAAAGIALSLTADLMTRISWAVSLAASGLFPMLFLAAIWPRVNSPSLAVGGLAGFAIALYYIAGTQFFPLHFLDLWQDYSNMPPWRFEALEEVRQNCRDGLADACGEARDMARELANWWGLDTRAAGVIGAPVGIALASLLSLLHLAFRRVRARA